MDNGSQTRLDYCQFLLSSQTNYTLTNYAEHIDTLSHDMVNRYLKEEKLTPSLVWEKTQAQIFTHEDGYIVFDDSVLDKNHSKNIEAVRWQYSGNAHKVIRGIGLVNCIYITRGQVRNELFCVIAHSVYSSALYPVV